MRSAHWIKRAFIRRAFKINEYSQKIREEFNKGGLFEGLIEKHLVKNNHLLKLFYTPDGKKTEKEEAAVAKHLKALEGALTDEEKKSIVQETIDLKKY